MRRLRPHLTYANIMVTLLAIGALTGGVAYAANTIGSADIINGQVKTADIGNNQVQSADVRDDTFGNGGLGSADIANNTVASGDIENGGLGGVDIADGDLNDEDIAKLSVVNFPANIPAVPAHECRMPLISGINAQGDHLLLTPNWDDASQFLTYSIQYRADAESALMHVCNPTNNSTLSRTTHFNLLVIDAQ